MAAKLLSRTMTITTVKRTGTRCLENVNPYLFGRKIMTTTVPLGTINVNTVGVNYMTTRARVQWSMCNNFKCIFSQARYRNILHYKGLCVSVTGQLKKDRGIWPHEHIIERGIFTSSTYKKSTDRPSATELTANVKSSSLQSAEPIHENVVTIPNLLSVSRIVASPYLAHVIINNADFSWALVIFIYAGLTDAVRYVIYQNFWIRGHPQ